MRKIILDTSSIIILLLGLDKPFAKKLLLSFKVDDQLKLYFSTQTFLELQETIKYPKLKQILNFNKVSKLIAQFKYFSEFAEPQTPVIFKRDPKDAMFLELAKEIKADYLVSNDKDLLELKKFETTKIITINDLKTVLGFMQPPNTPITK